MTSNEIRRKFLSFFEKRGHVVIPSTSLVPENDPSVLFNTAGMQPLVPYLLGVRHPKGDKLVNVQKCVRTTDIDDIGDNTHATFFEMLGNWSLGNYFKNEAIRWSYEFLTSKEEGLGLDPKRLYITCFEGDVPSVPASLRTNVPRDNGSAEIWESFGIPRNRIYFLGAEDNWWSPGPNGPCGPDTEMFYDMTKNGMGDLSKDDFIKATDEQKIVEVWNDVFMEYEKKDGKVIGKLKQKNVDTGAGLERLAMVLQSKNNIFDTDLFAPIMNKIKELAHGYSQRESRIVADHIRTSVFIISEGVTPSNTDRGYVLRKLLRRAIRYADVIGIPEFQLHLLAETVQDIYKETYPSIGPVDIASVISDEERRFRKTLEKGLLKIDEFGVDEFGHLRNITGAQAFELFSTYGFPLELTQEIIRPRVLLDFESFEMAFKKHQELSRTGAEKKFKGGLADTSEKSLRYHTATHLLNAALKQVLGDSVSQKGSNITQERLRFDFSHNKKMTSEEIGRVEDLVNQKIKEALPVSFEEMPIQKAREIGAHGVFGEKYDDIVRVYTVGNPTDIFSIEICGGPHVKNTGELGHFKIIKEEAVSAGVRRIKAVLE